MILKRLKLEAWCLLLAGCGLTNISTGESEGFGARVERWDTQRGLCVVLDDTQGDLALEIARSSELLVYAQVTSGLDAQRLCQRMAEAGLGVLRVQIVQGGPDTLHLADGIADVVVAKQRVQVPDEQELLRVLRPGGRLLLGTYEHIKPMPEGLGNWTHPLHGPDNNPVSLDRSVRAPYLTQFLANPRYGPAPQSTVAAGGRVFKAFGHIAWHQREEPFLNTLVAFNGFNGTLLWQRPLPEGLMVHRNTLIATAETLYLGDHESCKLIDTASGKTTGQIVPPLAVAGGTFWKWMALEQGTLFALVGEAEPLDGTQRWKRDGHGWPWNAISRGFNQPENPWGFGRNVLALDPVTHAVRWHYHEAEPMDGRAMAMKNGKLYAFRFGAYLTCLDAQTGQVLWRKTQANAPALFDALGAYQNRQSWQTNWRTAVYMTCGEHALYFAGTQLGKLLAVSTRDGSVLWQHPYDNFQLIVQKEAVYAISGPWGNNVSRKFDPLTGQVLAELPTGRRACTRVVATADSLLYRAMGGSVRFDLAEDVPRWLSPMRPSCHDGVTVANGLLYWWPYVCDCQVTLNGLTCLGAAGDFDFTPDRTLPERLQQQASGLEPGEIEAATPADWPTFRANNGRTCVTRAVLPRKSQILWQTAPSSLTGVRPTPPVAVGNRIVLADSEGGLRALDSQSGETLWRATTGGEIRIAPTLWQGRVLVGSGDGFLYAHAATDGRLLWRCRLAPVERRIPVYGKLMSTWPAASGVLVQDETAYVAAGLVNYDGTYVYALDPATGALRWCNATSGHLDPEAQTGVSVQGHLLLHEDKLYLAGGNAVSPAVYRTRDGVCLNDPAALVNCESTSPRGWELFLLGEQVIACGLPFYADPDIPVYDHTVTKKLLHASAGQYDIVWQDNRRLLCYPPLSPEELSRSVTAERIPRHITQAWGQFKVSEKPYWQRDVPGSVALAVCAQAVVIADASKVRAFALASGQELWQQSLPASPVPWGLAVDRNGHVILTLVDGRVLCVGPS